VVPELRALTRDAADLATRIMDEASLLGEAIGVDLSMMPLDTLRQLCRAVTRLTDAPAPDPSWAQPAQSHAASVVLAAIGDDLREIGVLRRVLYSEFSEDIWDLKWTRRVPPVHRWWHAIRRQRVRASLASVTRSGKPPTDVRAAVATVGRVADLHRGIDEASTALRGHLGRFAAPGIPDVDGAAEALAGMRDLQAALGDDLDPDRLRRLAAADAFVCDELAGPAGEISLLITCWDATAKRSAAVDQLQYGAPQLLQWTKDIARSLEVVSSLKNATAGLRIGSRTVGELFDDVVRRDRVHRLCETGRSIDAREGSDQ
jgi:hypothetical protein